MCWNFLSGRLFWFSVSLVSLYTMHLKERQYWHIVPLCFFAINFLWVLINHPHSNAKGKANRCILSRSENHLISALRISLAIIKFYFSPSYLKRYFSSVPPTLLHSATTTNLPRPRFTCTVPQLCGSTVWGSFQSLSQKTLCLAAQGRLAAHLWQGLEKSLPSNGKDVLSHTSAMYGQIRESPFG